MPNVLISYTGKNSVGTDVSVAKLVITESGLSKSIAWVSGPQGPQGPAGTGGGIASINAIYPLSYNSGNQNLIIDTGFFASTGDLQGFYLASNPSGYLTNLSGLSVSLLTNSSGVLQAQINGLNTVSGLFYLSSNPSGFLNNLSGLSIALITGISGVLQSQISSNTGTVTQTILNNTGQSLINYANSIGQSVSGSLQQTGILLSQLNSSSSGFLQSQISNLNNSTGLFYLNSNPSGYLNSLSGLSTTYVSSISGALQTQINLSASAISLTQTGSNLYSGINSLSGFVTGVFSGIQNTVNQHTAQINAVNGLTGLFYFSSNPSGYINSLSGLSINYVNSISGILQAQISSNTGSVTYTDIYNTGNVLVNAINSIGQIISGNLTQTGILLRTQLTGLSGFVQNNFYLNSNPSGYLSSLSGLSTTYVTNASGALQTQINLSATAQNLATTGSNLFAYYASLSGFTTGNYYLSSNPSGFLNSLSGLSTTFVTNASGILQAQINTVSGNLTQTGSNLYSTIGSLSGFTTGSLSGQQNTINLHTTQIISLTGLTGNLYLNSNPSGYINTLSGLSVGFVTGSSGVLQSQLNLINNATGTFYTRNNPSGYLNSLSGLSSGYVMSVSGYLQSWYDFHTVQINIIIGQLLELYAATGTYYLSSNPSGYLSSLSGLSINYVNSVSGVLQSQITGGSGPSSGISQATLEATGTAIVSLINNVSGVLRTDINTSMYYSVIA